MATPAKLTNDWSSALDASLMPAEPGAQIVAFRKTLPSRPPMAKIFPAGTISTGMSSLPIIMYRLVMVAVWIYRALRG